MATKEAYQKKLDAQLKLWDASFDQWSAKAQKAAADVRINYENELETLKKKRAAANKTFEELGRRSEGAWEEMKDGAERAWDEMSKAMDKMAARFK